MRRIGRWLLLAIAVWGALAYLVLPAFWRHYEHLPAMSTVPTRTRTPSGLPGDALNVALVGSKEDILRAFAAARWAPADPITFDSSLAIAASVVFHRPDPEPPVSTLLLFGRKQDLAFEQDVGGSAKERNHVRFWRSEEQIDGRPLWLGAATFDRGVGLSSLTGQITHHIAADVDTERDRVIHDLEHAGQLRTVFQVTGVGATFLGRNGGGDPYHTDGELDVGVLKQASEVAVTAPTVLPNPGAVAMKQHIWAWLRPWLDAVHRER